MRRYVIAAISLAAAAVAAWSLSTPAGAFDASGDEQQLFALTNQDRTSNGVASLSWNYTLGGIARANPNSSVCGFTIYGRSQDMVNRNYFSHVICGSHYVWDVMAADGVHYQSAGENIGWTTAPESSSASSINTAFMNSTEHRANILNGSFNQIGIGAAAGTSADSCCGGSSEIMYTEDFIQAASQPPPPPPAPKPSPKPTPISTGGGGGGGGGGGTTVPQPQPTRNSPAPPPPSVPPVAIATPNTPEESPSPSPTAAGTGREVRPAGSRPGLFELLVNRILQAFLNF